MKPAAAAAELSRVTMHLAACESILLQARAELRRIASLPAPSRAMDEAGRILEIVCAEFGISRESLCCRARPEHFTAPRQVAAFLIYRYTDLSTSQVAALLKRRDHSTILYSVRKVKERCATEPPFATRIAHLEKQVGRVTPCAPQPDANGARGATRPTQP